MAILLEKPNRILLRINKMKKYSVLFFASLLSFLMLPFAQANAAEPLSDLHADIMGEWKLDAINGNEPVNEPTLKIGLIVSRATLDVTLYWATCLL